jgi:hypothetical protein
MYVIAIVAIVIALFSLGFSIVQWISRYRPYIGIANLDLITIYREYTAGDTVLPDSIKFFIKNVGEAPARHIVMSAMLETIGYGKNTDKKEIKPQELGVLFPGQEVEVILSFDMYSQNVGSAFANGEGAIAIDSLIDYEGTPLLRWHRKHMTQQKHIIFQSPKSWRTLSGGDYS